MDGLKISEIDEITMRLVHYFVTKENYQPIIVTGLENEIWLENVDKPYEVIRINSNYIHNNEQLDYDLFKTKSVVKQIRKKMLALNCDTLNIFLNVGENVNIERNTAKHFDICSISKVEDLQNNTISELFPEILNDNVDIDNDMDFFIKVTHDINESTEKKNKIYEKTFKKKPLIITYALIAINVLIFFLEQINVLDVSLFATSNYAIKSGRFWVLITAAFFHGGIMHLLCNMYSLYIIGRELETVMGKIKFLIVYILSAIIGCLLSGVITPSVSSVGASGAIFGLMGALLYFGYHYRLYLGNVLVSQLVPVILINLFIGFMYPYIDNWAHIGGLVGGLFAAMMCGIEGKTDKTDTKNGIIITTVIIGFLLYMILFR